jgi:hypothetical protein
MVRSSTFVALIAVLVMVTGSLASAQQTGTITGTVTGPDKAPAANVNVQLRQGSMGIDSTPPPGVNSRGIFTPGWAANLLQKIAGQREGQDEKVLKTTKTDSSGKYTFTDVKPGSYVIQVGNPAAGGRREISRVEAGKTTTTDVQVQRVVPAS